MKFENFKKLRTNSALILTLAGTSSASLLLMSESAANMSNTSVFLVYGLSLVAGSALKLTKYKSFSVIGITGVISLLTNSPYPILAGLGVFTGSASNFVNEDRKLSKVKP